MIPALKLPLAVVSAALFLVAVEAQVITYENLGTAATAGYSEPMANNPIFGDALNMTQGGTLGSVGFSLFNSTSGGNNGSILAGTMVIKFYDNTAAYAGGALGLPLLGTATLNLDYSSDPLPAGFYLTDTFDISALNINVPQNIFVTQQFTMTSGTSTRNGIVLFSDPTVGSSPPNVYIKSLTTTEGLYTFTGNAGQFGYHIEVSMVPEPSTLALVGLGGLGALRLRRRRK